MSRLPLCLATLSLVTTLYADESRSDWFSRLKDKARGKQWYQQMDIGPVMAGTFQDSYQGKTRVGALKGLIIEINAKQGVVGLFDTETLRFSSAGFGKRILGGTPWTGRHGELSKVKYQNGGQIIQTSRQPGWANTDAKFTDTRPHPGHGNLPHARFLGHYRNGETVVIDYQVHGSRVLETSSAHTSNKQLFVYRQLDLAPCKTPRLMLITDDSNATATISNNGKQAILTTAKSSPKPAHSKRPNNPIKVITDRTEGDWQKLAMGAPSRNDSADRSKNPKSYFRVLPNFTPTHAKGGDEEGVAVRLNDGLSAKNNDDLGNTFFFNDTNNPGRLELDLTTTRPLHRIHLYSWHKSNRAPMRAAIYATTNTEADSALPSNQLVKSGWIHIADIDTTSLGVGGKHGAAVMEVNGKSFGSYRKLLIIAKTPDKKGVNHTFFSEIDVWCSPAPAIKPRAINSGKNSTFLTALSCQHAGVSLRKNDNGQVFLHIPASDKPIRLTLGSARTNAAEQTRTAQQLLTSLPAPRELESLTKGNKPLFPETVTTQMERKPAGGQGWITENIPLPTKNPSGSRMRVGDFDFFSDGDSAAICTWTGDVWIVRGLSSKDGTLTWRRFATGLFETLGLKIVDDLVYVHGRDQITRLHDLNSDGEADHYQNFNNDILITKNFHEFAFGLETDSEGNFYIAKGAPVLPGGRGFDDILPHNGIVARISKYGKNFEVLATGLRAPSGLGVGPNGEITTGENEGSWQPCCKLNYFIGKDKFFGVEDTAHHLKGKKMDLPLCYFPMNIDNSGGSQVWVPRGNTKWGLKPGELIHLSYGQSTLYRVLKEEVDGTTQGGVVRIPMKLHSSAQRACFHKDGSLYVSGFRGWQTNAATPQAIQRVRFAGGNTHLPDQLRATDKGIYLRFEQKLDPASVADVHNFKVERWKYVRSAMYGSGEFSVDHPDTEAEKLAHKQESKKYHHKRDKVKVLHGVLLDDGKTLFLQLAGMKTCEQMSIAYQLKFATPNTPVSGTIISTIHKMAPHTQSQLLTKETQEATTKKKLSPGLHQTITAGGKTTHRVARLAAEFTAKSDHVSDMLPTGQFTSTWDGFLDIEGRISPQFKLDGIGHAQLRIDAKLVFDGNIDGKLSAPIQLDPGQHAFQLVYTSKPDGAAQVRTLWQYKGSRLHPLSPTLFKHQKNKQLTHSQILRRGKELFHAQNCQQCHSNTEDKQTAPNLTGIGNRLHPTFIAKWLRHPHSIKPTATMPAMFNPDSKQGQQDTADITAYLTQNSKPAPVAETNADFKAAAKLGGAHFHRLGCAACHTQPDRGFDKATQRVPLQHVGAKFSQSSLIGFLKNPAKHHPNSKMPNFGLTDPEAKQIASYLQLHSQQKANPAADQTQQGNATRGKQLVAQHNCAACHQGTEPSSAKLPQLAAILKTSWENQGCVSAKSPGKTPKLNLTASDRKALETFRQAHIAQATPISNTSSPHDFANSQIKQLNCLACHSRDGIPSGLSTLHPETKHLTQGVPAPHQQKVDQSRPHFTHLGDMLHTDYMAAIISGNAKHRARPWLSMRMPGFHTDSQKLADGIAYQHGQQPSQYQKPKLNPSQVKSGAKLIGSNGGFACTICHGDGDQKALAAFEVEGVNFAHVAERLRPDYFYRWMHNPTALTPNTKMPRYTQDNKSPLPDQDGDAGKQFQAILQYLHSRSAK